MLLRILTAITLCGSIIIPFVAADTVRYLGYNIASKSSENIFDDWRRLNPQHTLEITYLTNVQLAAGIQRDMEVDHAYDVYQTNQPIFESAADDLIADVTELVKDPKFQWADVPPTTRDWLTTYEDRVYGIPVDANGLVMHYRRDLIDTPPTTWEELIEVATRFHGQDLNGDGIPDYGTCLITERQFAMYAWTIANTVFRYKNSKLDGYLFDIPVDGTTEIESLLETEGWEYVMETLAKLYNVSQGWPLKSGIGPKDVYKTFRNGHCATMITFPSSAAQTTVPPNGTFMRTRLGTARTPGSTKVFDRKTRKLVPCTPELCRFQEYGGVNRPGFIAGGITLMIRKGTPVLDAAADFAAYFSVRADTRKAGALNPYRTGHFNATQYTELQPVGWDLQDATQFTSALFDTMSSDRSASVPRLPGGKILAAEMERSMKEAIRYKNSTWENATTTYRQILTRTKATFASALADQGLDAERFDALWRVEVGAPPRRVIEKEGFPTWAILVIIIVVLGIIGVVVYFLRRHMKTAAAPKNENDLVTVLIVTVKNAAVLSEEFPIAMATMTKEYEAMVRAAVSSSGCYHVKRLGEAFMIVGKSPSLVADCVADIRRRYENSTWWHVDPNQQGVKQRKFGKNGNASDGSSTGSRLTDSRSVRSGGSVTGTDLRDIFEISCGVQSGTLRITHDEEANTYDYHGTAVSDAATAADVALAGQDLAVESFSDSLPDAYTRVVHSEFTTRTIRKQSMKLYQMNVDGLQSKTFTAPKSTEDADDGGANSVLAALDNASGSLGRKRITALFISFHQLHEQGNGDKDKLSKNYTKLIDMMGDVLTNSKGHLHSAFTGDFIITFNAQEPAASHIKKATIAYHDLKHVAQVLGLKMNGAIVSGNAFVGHSGAACTEHQVCITSLATKGRALLGLSAQFGALGVECLADGTILDELTTCVKTYPLDVVDLPQAKEVAPSILYGVGDLLEGSDDDEWMYVLAKTSPMNHAGTAFQAITTGNVDQAKEALEKCMSLPEAAKEGGNSNTPNEGSDECRWLSASVSKLQNLLALAESGSRAVTPQGPFFEAAYLGNPKE